MVKGNVILKKLGKEKFCNWLRKHGSKFTIDLTDADLRGADLRGADLTRTNLTSANLTIANLTRTNLRGADLTRTNLDFSCLPLWCGSANMKIDERIAKQLLAHAFNAGLKYFPGNLTSDQINWLNDFHRIQSGEFPKFK